MGVPPQAFRISTGAFEPGALRDALADPGAGALATFEGWVRDHHAGQAVRGLRYEAYPALAEAEGMRIVRDAIERHGCLRACCVHRVGELAVGDLAVWVGVSAAHRGPAFAACREIIDEVKARVPIWKYERFDDGSAAWQHPEPPSR